MRQIAKRKKVYVGISGGVDSAVAAALLQDRGYDVRGIFLREYDLSLPSAFGDAIHCTQEGDRQSALAVAASLDIPFEEWDFRKEYDRAVIRYMIREYKAGRTPNPDILCNSVIKFGLFFERALREGADCIATGHYARLRQGEKTLSSRSHRSTRGELRRGSGRGVSSVVHSEEIFHLLQARDTNKDQTYFLSRLTQEQLRYCLFPIGHLLKTEVRVRAKVYGLPNWNRKDSQGICFIGKLSMKEFLQRMIPQKRGPLMTRDGLQVGTHDGAAFFTIGQRHGLGFEGGGEPYYVVGKDMKKNIVFVDHKKSTSALFGNELICSSVNWISGYAPTLPFTCTARTRYRQPLQHCLVSKSKVQSPKLLVTFIKPQLAITPGQFVVFYKRRECLGSGVID